MSTLASRLTRRTLLAASAASATALGEAPALAAPASSETAASGGLLRDLDRKIETAMARYAIPGVAVGVLWQGREYVRGYGVTNVDHPVPVDGDTIFRIGSTTKTFTGTTAMRLVEAGKLALDAPVRRYLPDFRTSDPAVAERVTVRQLLNHTAGWLGDYLTDTGPGDDAAARYAAGIARLPQLTAPGAVFFYNNAAVELAGRVIEVAARMTYEAAVRALVVDPLGLAHSRFFTDEIIGFNIAASHDMVNGKPVVQPDYFRLWRSLNAAGGLISSARDQLRYARFHLGDGTVPGGGPRLLSHRSLLAMRSDPGPGGTLFVELDGVGVTWMLRPSAEGVRIVQHGGDWAGQHSGLIMVPERGFAMTLLTNSETGPALIEELFVDDWALRRFAGVSNLPAVPRKLTPQQLAEYTGHYSRSAVGPGGEPIDIVFDLVAGDGDLLVTLGGVTTARLKFYRTDYALLHGPGNEPGASRVNFERGSDGRVDWLRLGGRLARRATTAAAARATASTPPATLFRHPWAQTAY
ncbi:beta-lactamase family protein [Dactylosporangium roseum]|uniref:Beta-lactamase family protein n=1 Tax=Dactylosporangium roseum TaxID=47989 RepID=A0ABY5Z0S6_9ACTN|nr:serine hydrolase domain-containing protein [Dactylosporangium roseum]UWZ34650.1 beta-lactamase family protein [Dactylosporangium roseum]